VADDNEDRVPSVATTVDLFNALFQAKCMQSAGSIWTTAGIITIDAVENVYALWKLMNEVGDDTDEIRSKGLLPYCMALLAKPRVLNLTTVEEFQVQSVKKMMLSVEKKTLI
jgi:hypothetical protein